MDNRGIDRGRSLKIIRVVDGRCAESPRLPKRGRFGVLNPERRGFL
jgi:hypothetical protein